MLANFSRHPKKYFSQINQFLFADAHHEQLGIFRFILCGTLFYMACFRQLNIDQLGIDSLIPRDLALNVFPDFYRPAVQWFFWPDAFVGPVHLLLIGLLFLATIGLTNRPLLILTWIIHQGILNRNYAILFGADVIGGLFLFYLSFTHCTEFFSVRNLIFKSKNKITSLIDTSGFLKNQQTAELHVNLSAVCFRLIQVQICTIYMYTGFEKLKGNTWWDGTALWTVFANPQFSQYDLKFLSQVPVLFAIGTFLSLIFEIYFPAMVINSKFRNFWLVSGVLFHVGIGVLLGLMTFSMVMLSTYVLFLDRQTIVNALPRWQFFPFQKAS